MRAGQISAGNARDLADLIRRARWQALEEWLEVRLTAARQRGCGRMLLSSEWLLGALALPGRLAGLETHSQRCGVDVVDMLLILRAPVDQLISHYKHRAKSGQVSDIASWAEQHYLLPGRLAGLRSQLDQAEATLTVRAYSKQKGALATLFFQDWLGIAPPPIDADPTVNPSLSFSELTLIRKLRGFDPGLVPHLYNSLLGVDASSKAEDSLRGNHARRVAGDIVARYSEEWAHWYARLPEAERFPAFEPTGAAAPAPDAFLFSETQMAAVTRLLADAATPGFILRKFWRARLRPSLARIRRGFFGRSPARW